mmetsp:Transcript_28392/g.21198  ORF Transcript_28392/g.21198 Transcript_28392/m.21198 type:complete len:92 (-) Transcript_28392:691-966(-)
MTYSFCQSAQVPAMIANQKPDQSFKLPVFFGLFLGLVCKVGFGILGSIAFESAPNKYNLFGNLLYSPETPNYLIVAVLTFAVLVVVPVTIH